MQGYPAEISDLMAGEFQDAFEQLINSVKHKLGMP
jgi:hypothetical protein